MMQTAPRGKLAGRRGLGIDVVRGIDYESPLVADERLLLPSFRGVCREVRV